MKSKLSASWIWTDQLDPDEYNSSAIFHKEFTLPAPASSVEIAIAADSWYRLRVNGVWINDGPARNYPNHFQYDLIDLSGVVVQGINEVEVIVRYFGIGTAHQLPRQGGLLAQIDGEMADGSRFTISTDRTWKAGAFSPLLSNTARFSIKQEGAEWYDARLEGISYGAAYEVSRTDEGPWTGLHPRDCQLLTKCPTALRRFVAANIVTSNVWCISIPAQRLLHPKLKQNNFSTSLACGVAYRVDADEDGWFDVILENICLYINGRLINEGTLLQEQKKIQFSKGRNLLVALAKYPFENQMDLGCTVVNPHGLSFLNPVNARRDTVCFLNFPQHSWLGSEIPLHMWANKELHERQRRASDDLAMTGQALASVSDMSSPPSCVVVEERGLSEFSADDAHWAFRARQVVHAPSSAVDGPSNLIYDNAHWTTVHPVDEGDVELVYDFAEQQCGYFSFEIDAEEGTVVDLFAVEHMQPDGVVQHTDDVRNGFRYICHEGINRYTSVRRRSGRFLFMTIRETKKPVRVRRLCTVTSTYPVDQQGTFHCSNEQYNRIWDISVRTIKLCMEDVFTDCPCYEQSLWTGDARNTALFSFSVFRPWDLARRCIRLGGHSLERYPIVGSQVPSAWDCLIPVWSFLWEISVWDYYLETADKEFLREVFPMVCRNMDGALEFIDQESGLFSMQSWNLFEWVETDIHHPQMVYNSMMLFGALNAAVDCAKALEETSCSERYQVAAERLRFSISATWSDDLRGYPDSVRQEGEDLPDDLPANLIPCTEKKRDPGPCRDVSVHTSMLAVLFDIADADVQADLAANVMEPRPELFRVRNLFAKFYLYQAYEKLGRSSAVLGQLAGDYTPMIELGSTTTWENINGYYGFPARSHSHSWSACAVYFYHRLILGLKLTTPGALSFDLSPEVDNLTSAEGYRATIHGPIYVAWRKKERELWVQSSAPECVSLQFVRNDSMRDYAVYHNGSLQSQA